MTTGTGATSAVGCVHQSALSADHGRALKAVLAITALFMLVEIAGGVVANSLALLADAGHMLTDVAAIGLSIISVIIALLILTSAWRLVRESVNVLLEGTPAHVSVSDVQSRLAGIPGVHDVHDLHVWTVTSGVVAMSGHVVVREPELNQPVLETAQRRLADMGIQHVTMQIEQKHTCVEPERV